MRILVFGVTGVQGVAQVRALRREGHTPVGVVRTDKPLAVDDKPVETIKGDYSDHASLDRVFTESNTDAPVFLSLPSTSFQDPAPIVAACGAMGVAAKKHNKFIIFNTSIPLRDERQDFRAIAARWDMRKALREGGADVLSVEPVVFLDNLLQGWAWPYLAETNTIMYSHKDSLQASWICLDDVASIMVGVAQQDRKRWAGRNLPVGGIETVVPAQLAEKLGRAWGRDIKYKALDMPEFGERMRQAMPGGKVSEDGERLIGEVQKLYTHFNNAPEEPFKVDMEPVLEELPEVKMSTIEEWGRRVLPTLEFKC